MNTPNGRILAGEGAATEWNLSEWISILGVLCQLLVGSFFLGITYQIIKTVVRDAARTDQRVDNLEVRVNDHDERIRAIETRENECKWRVAVLNGDCPLRGQVLNVLEPRGESATKGNRNHISFLAGGGVKYNLTNSLSWQTLQAQCGQFGPNCFAILSTGLAFIFGK